MKLHLPRLLLAVPGLALLGFWVFTPTPDNVVQAGERKISVYQDSMHPWVKSDRPGKCTICGMDLTPIHEGERGFEVGKNMVVLSSNAITVLNVQTAPVQRQSLGRTLRVAGTLNADETHKTIVSSPARGRIDALAVDYAGVEVAKGQRLITLFSPELQQQNRILFAARLVNQGGGTNAVDHNPYAKFDPSSGASFYSSDLLAPQSGIVVERNVYNGQYVTEGEKLFTIVDASVMWFRFDVYEQQLPWLQVGQVIDVTTPSVPGKKLPAVISFIEPTLDQTTRTVKVRADIKNPLVGTNARPQRLLRFGVFAEGRVRAEAPDALVVPRAAILFPGGAAYAYVEKNPGAYERRRLTLGRQGDQHWEVLQGLEEGDRVVTTGNVLIDAQAQFSQGDDAESAGEEESRPAMPPSLDLTPAGSVAATSEAEAPRVASDADALQPPQPHVHSGKPDTAAPHEMGMPEVARPGATMPPDSAPPPPRGEPHSAMPPRSMAAMVAATTNALPAAPESAVPGVPIRVNANRNGNILRAATRDQMKQMRWATIVEAYEKEAAEAAEAARRATNSPPATPAAASEAKPPAGHEMPPPAIVAPGRPDPKPVPVPTNRPLNYREADAARRALSAEMQQTRRAAMAAANGSAATNAAGLAAGQRSVMDAFLKLAADLSEALAADNLGKAGQCLTNLPLEIASLERECATSLPRRATIQRLGEIKFRAAADLDDARKQFLPFSTLVVELTQRLRAEDATYASLKVYHCPMAPKPGLWMQAQGPLRNPFYGSKMLTCGEEVRPPSPRGAGSAAAASEADAPPVSRTDSR